MDDDNSKVISFCIGLIRRRRKISVKELYEAAKKEFPNYVFTKRWLSRNVKKAIEGTDIVKWRPANRELVFGLEEELKKNYKRCIYCGKLIPPNYPKWCSKECYKELEKVANFFVPLPDFSFLSTSQQASGTRPPQKGKVLRSKAQTSCLTLTSLRM